MWLEPLANHALGAWRCSGKKTFVLVVSFNNNNCICEVSIMMEAGLEDVKGYVVGWWGGDEVAWWDANFNLSKDRDLLDYTLMERERERELSYTSVLSHPSNIQHPNLTPICLLLIHLKWQLQVDQLWVF